MCRFWFQGWININCQLVLLLVLPRQFLNWPKRKEGTKCSRGRPGQVSRRFKETNSHYIHNQLVVVLNCFLLYDVMLAWDLEFWSTLFGTSNYLRQCVVTIWNKISDFTDQLATTHVNKHSSSNINARSHHYMCMMRCCINDIYPYFCWLLCLRNILFCTVGLGYWN